MKTVVVGAGVGGLTSALLASLRNEDVTLYESHSHLGGCSSYFKRGSFVFDVGATTISGLGANEPLGKLFHLIGRKPALKLADPGIVFHLNDKIISYYHDFDSWMVELEKHFPHLNHRPFWKLVKEVNHQGWDFLDKITTFPLKSPSDLWPFVKHPKSFFLLPYLMLSTELVLKKFQLDDAEYLQFINGMLLISAQSEAKETPFLVGAMGLNYPSETYAPVGGMKGIVDFFEEELALRKVEIRKNTCVSSFNEDRLKIVNQSDEHFDRLILNLPIWNLAKMAEGEIATKLHKESDRHPGYWGAFMLYLGAKCAVASPYHQIHLGHPEIPHYFASFSLPDDQQRAPAGFQTVTISAHVPAGIWMSLSEQDYRAQKKILGDMILRDFCERFEVTETKFVTTGTPRTFFDFTQREMGYVGGIPLVIGKNPFTLLSHEISQKLYRVGDTVFPGQGWSGVTAGSLALDERLRS